jgi:proton-translocating NADH-quinone oxidoreductase chain N
MFIQEFLLLFYIVFSLLYSCYIKLNNFNFSIDLKKHFLVLINLGILILILIFCLNFSFFIFNLDQYHHIYDDIIYYSHLNHFLNESFGIYFFRIDLITFFLMMFLSFIFILYMFLVKHILRSTNIEYKYILELPILIIVIFLSLHLFLLTYDLILIILTLELTAFCSVLLIGLHVSTKINIFSLEAAIKYFIFSATPVLLLLFALSGYYFIFNTFNLLEYKVLLANNAVLAILGTDILLFFHCFFFIALFFKLGAAPFHFWVADVYEGAELLITAFLVLIISPTICCKLIFFVKILLPFLESKHILNLLFCLLGLLSIGVGTLKAFQQFKIKRFLAYTSITHLGYILLSLSTGSYFGFFAAFFYLFIYILTNILFFFILLLIRNYTHLSLLFFNQFKQIFNTNLFLLLLFIIPIFSYAGFPPFLGFFTKFLVLLSLIDFNQILLTTSLIIYIVINAYLYLRITKLTLFENQTNNLYLQNDNKLLVENNFKIQFSFLNKDNITINNKLLILLLLILICLIFFGCCILSLIINIFLQPLISLFLFY